MSNKKTRTKVTAGGRGEKPATAKKSGNTGKFELIVLDTCKKLGLKVEKEYKFLPDRRFRFDFAIPDMKVACEYEGVMSAKSRHTTITGYTGDCTKYNLAALNGWRVMRYTTLNMGQVIDDLKAIINQ